MKDKILLSESGKFICTVDGYAYGFEPTEENKLDVYDGYRLVLKHFIIPEGVIGFCENFGRGMIIKEQFVLPKTLRVIGKFLPDGWDAQCVFADTKLPTVIIPETVEFTGVFAFGDSEIDALCLPREYTEKPKEYVRAYKNCYVHKLYVHCTGLDAVLNPVCGKGDKNFSYGLVFDELYAYQDKESECLPINAERIR